MPRLPEGCDPDLPQVSPDGRRVAIVARPADGRALDVALPRASARQA